MDINKFIDYVKLFSDLYAKNTIEINWRKESPGFRSSISLDTELPKINSSFSEEEFLPVAFKIIKISISLALEEEPDDISQEEINVVSDIFLSESNLKQYIYIQCTSNAKLLKSISGEILTKRNIKNPLKIIGYTALLNLMTTYSNDDRLESVVERTVIELTKSEISELIKELKMILISLEQIEKEEGDNL